MEKLNQKGIVRHHPLLLAHRFKFTFYFYLENLLIYLLLKIYMMRKHNKKTHNHELNYATLINPVMF
jgi:Na+/H+ antiporter NhaC